MSGESCVSGEVRVPLYKFSVAEPYPAKAEVDSISFDVSVDPNTIQLDSWYVTEEYNPSTLYKCSFENSNSSQLTCFSGGAKSVVS
jgi:hypothetical protein